MRDFRVGPEKEQAWADITVFRKKNSGRTFSNAISAEENSSQKKKKIKHAGCSRWFSYLARFSSRGRNYYRFLPPKNTNNNCEKYLFFSSSLLQTCPTVCWQCLNPKWKPTSVRGQEVERERFRLKVVDVQWENTDLHWWRHIWRPPGSNGGRENQPNIQEIQAIKHDVLYLSTLLMLESWTSLRPND